MCEISFIPESYLPNLYPQICILDTDINEPEILIKKMAADVSHKYPELFKGNEPQVFYKMKYVPAYEQFHEIKNMILQIKHSGGVVSRYQGILAVDVSEYKGHEEDEYFQIFLKYLYDNTRNVKVVLVCCQYREKDLERLFRTCMKYFPVQYDQINIFETEQLKKIIRTSFKKCAVSVSAPSVDLIAEALLSKALIPYRNIQLVNRIPLEITGKYTGKSASVTIEDIVKYFRNPNTSVCLMAGRALISEKEYEFE